MIHQRDSERGAFRSANLELIMFVGIVGILAAIAMPILLQRATKKGRACLENLAAGTEKTDGKVPCPACGKLYGPVLAKDVETLACPDPSDHLSSSPRFVRTVGKPWALEQTLPPYGGEPIEVKGSSIEIREQPGRTAVFVKPSFASRWLLAGFLLVFLGAIFLVFFGSMLREAAAGKWSSAAGGLFVTAVLGTILWFVFASAASSHQWVFEPGSARATRTEYLAGSVRSEKTYAGCLGVVPTGKAVLRLELVHAPDAEGARVTTVEEVPLNRLDIARWYNRAVTGK